jgi:hypothetical protein
MTRLTTVARWAVLGALPLLAGCSGTPPGLFIIVQNQVPDSNCAIPATLGSVYRPSGVLDVRLTSDGSDGYFLFPLLQNDFPAPTGGSSIDANRIALSGFDIDVDVPANPEAGPITDFIQMLRALDPSDPRHSWVQFSTVTSGSVSSGGGNTASDVDIFPGDLARAIRDLAVLSTTKHYFAMATVRARGGTLSSSVKSDAFHYPIELCDGCLIVNQGDCPVAATGGNTCDVGQDESTGCCTVSGSFVCQAVVSSK